MKVKRKQRAQEVLNMPWWQKKTVWSAIVGIVTAIFTLIGALTSHDPVMAGKVAVLGTTVGVIINSLGTIFARQGGVEAAEHVDRKLEEKHEAPEPV